MIKHIDAYDFDTVASKNLANQKTFNVKVFFQTCLSKYFIFLQNFKKLL